MKRSGQELQLASFRLGETLFALDIMRIREIIEPRVQSSLPGPSRFLEGIITLRGEVIPVMDLRRCFGMPPRRDESASRYIIVRLVGMTLALDVDDVLEVIDVSAAEIKAPPDIGGTGAECILGVCLSGERVFMILDIDILLDAVDCSLVLGDDRKMEEPA